MPIAKFGILASVAIVSAALGQSVAFAWGVGGGGIGIPGFGALWQQPVRQDLAEERTSDGTAVLLVRGGVKARKRASALPTCRQASTAVRVRLGVSIWRALISCNR